MGTNNYLKIAAKESADGVARAREFFFFDDGDDGARDRAFAQASEALRDYAKPRLSLYRRIPGWPNVREFVGVASAADERS